MTSNKLIEEVRANCELIGKSVMVKTSQGVVSGVSVFKDVKGTLRCWLWVVGDNTIISNSWVRPEDVTLVTKKRAKK